MSALPTLRIGHAQDPVARTGCTVLLGPFRAACEVRGLASGSRELDALSPLHLTPRANALVLTGGSAFGLASAQGVVAWLEERGEGFQTGSARVPIVPAAVLYDLGVGRADRRPDEAMGREACEAAVAGNNAEGAVGAGAGATVGKILGPQGATESGLGLWWQPYGDYTFLGLAAVNALGDILDAEGRIIAGARRPDGSFADTARLLRSGPVAPPGTAAPPPGTNTTLAVVATDVPLSKTALALLARVAATALARRISPVGTVYDGDMVFALTVSSAESPATPTDLLGFGAAATFALENAIERAVRRDAGPGL